MSVDDPAERRTQGTADHNRARPELVDEPTLDGHEPGFGDDEDGERGLDCRVAPMVGVVHRYNEQCPRILKIRDEAHAHDADRQLHPAVMPECRAVSPGYVGMSHVFRLLYIPSRWNGALDLRDRIAS